MNEIKCRNFGCGKTIIKSIHGDWIHLIVATDDWYIGEELCGLVATPPPIMANSIIDGYGKGVGVMIEAIEIDGGPSGRYWEVYAVHGCEHLNPSDVDYLTTLDTVEQVLAYATIACAQVNLLTQAWFEANCDELDGS